MTETEAPSRLTDLRTSARGWHGVQIATIGFIGLCGVLQRGRPDNPTWLQVCAGILAVAALVLACAGTFLVARVAWPLYGGRTNEAGDLVRDAARLRRGLVYTFSAVAVVALATASGWWPQPGGGTGAGATASVSVQAANGQRLCGTLVDAGPGRIGVSANGGPVAIALADVAALAPVGSC